MATATMTYPATLKTPIEIQVPAFACPDVIDHGLTLVHEMGGEPRNYLHEVSIPAYSQSAESLVSDFGYAYSCGYYKDGRQYKVYLRQFGLMVAAW